MVLGVCKEGEYFTPTSDPSKPFKVMVLNEDTFCYPVKPGFLRMVKAGEQACFPPIIKCDRCPPFFQTAHQAAAHTMTKVHSQHDRRYTLAEMKKFMYVSKAVDGKLVPQRFGNAARWLLVTFSFVFFLSAYLLIQAQVY